MSTNTAPEKSQTALAIERTEKLLLELKQASDFVETKNAIIDYISDIDCCSDAEDNPFVLGDADFAHLFVKSLERRGKTPIEKWVPAIIRCAQVEHSPVVKQLIENCRSGLAHFLGN